MEKILTIFRKILQKIAFSIANFRIFFIISKNQFSPSRLWPKKHSLCTILFWQNEAPNAWISKSQKFCLRILPRRFGTKIAFKSRIFRIKIQFFSQKKIFKNECLVFWKWSGIFFVFDRKNPWKNIELFSFPMKLPRSFGDWKKPQKKFFMRIQFRVIFLICMMNICKKCQNMRKFRIKLWRGF